MGLRLKASPERDAASTRSSGMGDLGALLPAGRRTDPTFESLHRRHMGVPRPTTVGARSDDPDPYYLRHVAFLVQRIGWLPQRD